MTRITILTDIRKKKKYFAKICIEINLCRFSGETTQTASWFEFRKRKEKVVNENALPTMDCEKKCNTTLAIVCKTLYAVTRIHSSV